MLHPICMVLKFIFTNLRISIYIIKYKSPRYYSTLLKYEDMTKILLYIYIYENKY